MKDHFLLTIRAIFILLFFNSAITKANIQTNCHVEIDVEIVQPVYNPDDCEQLVSRGKATYTVINLPDDLTSVSIGPKTASSVGDQGEFELGEGGDTYDFTVDVGIYGSQQFTGTLDEPDCPEPCTGLDLGCGCGQPAPHPVCGCDFEDNDNDQVPKCADPDDNNKDVPGGESYDSENGNDPDDNTFARMATTEKLYYDVGESQYFPQGNISQFRAGPYVLCAYEDGTPKWKKVSIQEGVFQLGVTDVAYDPTSPTNDGIIIGDFENSLNFMGFDHETYKAGYYDSYIIKFDGDGNTKWANHVFCDGDTYLKKITCLADGSIIVTGTHSGNLYYKEHTYQSKGTNRTTHAFVLKLNNDGEPIWYQSEINSRTASIIAIHEQSMVIGYISLQAAVGFSNQRYAAYRNMLMKIDLQTGNKLAWGGQSHDSYKAVKIVSTHIEDRHYYVCTQQIDVANNRIWLQITHYDENLQHTWTKTVAATDKKNLDSKANGIAINNKGNLLMSTDYENTVWIQESMESELTTSYTSKGEEDILLLELDTLGNYVSSQSLGNEGVDMALHLNKTYNGSLVFGGCYSGALEINDETLREPNSQFISFFKVLETAEDDPISNTSDGIKNNDSNHSLTLYPNPNNKGDLWISYPFDSHEQYRIQLRDVQGKLLEEVQVHGISESQFFMDIHQLSAGTYTVVIISNENTVSETLLVH